MKTRWYRRIGGKHVKFNLSKSGVSTSFKLGPVTINPQRNRYSINTPVKGLSLRGKLADEDPKAITNKAKYGDLSYVANFFKELEKSLIENGLYDLIKYTKITIDECNNETMDRNAFLEAVRKLDEGLRISDAEVDDNIYKVLDQCMNTFEVKPLFKRKEKKEKQPGEWSIGEVIVIFVVLLVAISFWTM